MPADAIDTAALRKLAGEARDARIALELLCDEDFGGPLEAIAPAVRAAEHAAQVLRDAVSPDVLLALLDRLGAAERDSVRLAEIRASLPGVQDTIATMLREVEALRSDLGKHAAESFVQGMELASATMKAKRLEGERDELAAEVAAYLAADGAAAPGPQMRAAAGVTRG